jgi:hypothetical protein
MLVIASDRMLMRNAYKLAVRMIGGKNIQLVSISIKAQARFSQHRQKQRLEFLSIDIGLSNSSLSIGKTHTPVFSSSSRYWISHVP